MAKLITSSPTQWARALLAPDGAPLALWGAAGEVSKLAMEDGAVRLDPGSIASAASYLDLTSEALMVSLHRLIAARWLAPLTVDGEQLVTQLTLPTRG